MFLSFFQTPPNIATKVIHQTLTFWVSAPPLRHVGSQQQVLSMESYFHTEV